MTDRIIPLSSGAVNAHQRFSTSLGDVLAEISLDYRHIEGKWSIKINVEGSVIVTGILLETGINLLQHYVDLSDTIGSLYFVGEEATLDNLGISNSLVWRPPANG